MIPWSLILGVGKWVGILAGIAALYFVIDGRGYDRGKAATEKASMEALNRMEARLREALKKNESLTNPELDCALKRLRQPNAPCE